MLEACLSIAVQACSLARQQLHPAAVQGSGGAPHHHHPHLPAVVRPAPRLPGLGHTAVLPRLPRLNTGQAQLQQRLPHSSVSTEDLTVRTNLPPGPGPGLQRLAVPLPVQAQPGQQGGVHPGLAGQQQAGAGEELQLLALPPARHLADPLDRQQGGLQHGQQGGRGGDQVRPRPRLTHNLTQQVGQNSQAWCQPCPSLQS